MVTTNTSHIRDLMPEWYTTKIAEMIRKEGGVVPATSNLSQVVNQERITSKYWKYVERLALQTDPEAYHARMEELREARGMNDAA